MQDSQQNPKKVYYDPKLFRGSRSAIKGSRISKVALIFTALGLVGVAWEYGGVKDFFYDKLGLANPAKTIRDSRSELRSIATDPVISTAIEKSTPKTKLCEKRESVDLNRVAEYLNSTLALLASMSQEISSLQTSQRDKSTRVNLYNYYVAEVSKTARFFNEHLTKCFSDPALANEVSMRADTLRITLETLKSAL